MMSFDLEGKIIMIEVWQRVGCMEERAAEWKRRGGEGGEKESKMGGD